MLTDLIRWISVAALAAGGLLGLFYAAKGGTPDATIMGMGIFLVAVAWIALIIRRGCMAADQALRK